MNNEKKRFMNNVKKNEITNNYKNFDYKNNLDYMDKSNISSLEFHLKSNEQLEDSELNKILEINEKIEDGEVKKILEINEKIEDGEVKILEINEKMEDDEVKILEINEKTEDSELNNIIEINKEIEDDTIEENTEKEDEKYLTYCDDGYLRGLLKNAVVSSGVHIFLGTKIISFLNEKERYICSFACKLLYFEVYSLNNLKDLYRNKFISNEKRSFIWKTILLADNTYMSKDLYKKLKKESGAFDKIIEKDIYRTFPHNPYFLNKKENMQKKLLDILKVCSIYFKSVGYCQGMNYIAATFLLVFQNKLDTIKCFISLLKNFNLKGMFIYNFPELKKIIYQLNILIKAYMPKLFYYFKKNKIKIDFFCINWFMTLFSLDLCFENTLKLWDTFFLFGPKILIKLSLVILHHHQKKILIMPYDQALTFLKSITKSAFINYLFNEKNYFNYLKKFKVTNRMLRQIIMLKKSNEKIKIQVTKKDGKIKCLFILKDKDENKNKNKSNNYNKNQLLNNSNVSHNPNYPKIVQYFNDYYNIKSNKVNISGTNKNIKNDIITYKSNNNDTNKIENIIAKENNALIETNTYYDFNLTKSVE